MHDLKPKHLGAMPTVQVLAIRLAYERVQANGIEPGPLLKKAGLTKQQVENVDTRLSVESQIRFLKLVANALHDDFLGVHLAEQLVDLRRIGLLYYVMASADTLGEGLRRVVRYGSMTNESLSLKYLKGKDIRIVINYVGVARHLDQHQIESWLTALIRVCRQATGRPVEPSHVRLIHRRTGNVSELAAFLGKDIKFGEPVDEVIFPLSIADIPIVSADPYLTKLLIANAEESLSHRPTKQGSFRATVENTIVPLLPHGNARETEIATRCGLSRRTLARRLASEGLTFSKVLDELRHDLAARYSADHSLSISQIAWLLGYQEVGAFTNAFKRWTGKTPREARTELRRLAS